MGKFVFAMLASLVLQNLAVAAPPPDDVVDRLTKIVKKHCPDAECEVTDKGFVAKHATMTFTLHRFNADAYSEVTYEEEGPNLKGFLLKVELVDGPFVGATAVPQTFTEPYYQTYFDAPELEEGAHYRVHFSFGRRLDPALKKAILEAVPKKPKATDRKSERN